MSARGHLLAAAAAVILLGACTAPIQRPASSGDASDIREQLFKLQKDSARILSTLEHEGADAEGDASERAACAVAVTRLGEMQQQMQVLEEQLLETQKRLDDTLLAVRTLQRASAPSWADTSPPARPTAPPDPGAATASTAEANGAAAPAGTSSAPATGGMVPEDLFSAAYADYSRGRYELALAGFEGALRADPGGPLADDSQYWIGECLAELKRWLDAVAAFDHLIAAYPESDKIARAHLKKGIYQFEGRRRAEGVQTLEYVISTWPDSDEARIAQEYFRRKGILQE